jgi:hypothetical protein
MDAILSFLANPGTRYVLTMVVGFLMKRNEAFFNKAIPALTLAMNIFIALMAALFGVEPAHASFGSIVSGIGGSLIRDAILPWLLAHGTHTVVKNGVLEWKKGGWKITVG